MKFFFVLSPEENPDMYITGDPEIKDVLTDNIAKAHHFRSDSIKMMAPLLIGKYIMRVVMDRMFISGPIRLLSLQEIAKFDGIETRKVVDCDFEEDKGASGIVGMFKMLNM